MAERYKVDGWGDKEVELVASIDWATDVPGGWLMVVADGERWRAIVPKGALTPVKPPTPPEPEPGAYLIGEHLAVLSKSIGNWICEAGDEANPFWDWEPLWREVGGPDVTITRLVPERVETVELPWRHTDNDGDRVTVTLGGNIDVNGDVVVLNSRVQREMAAALRFAASRTES